MKEHYARTGETIFREGEFGDAIYLIVEGSLQLTAGGTTLLSRHRGECVGEFALMDNAPRSASAVAESDVILLRWAGDDFDRAMRDDESRSLSDAVLKMLTRKLREDVDRQHAGIIAPGAVGGEDRYHKINAIFQAALELTPEKRGSFLEKACSGDPALVAEVDALLVSQKEMGDFLEWYLTDEKPAPGGAAAEGGSELEELEAPSDAGLEVGSKLGAYEIVEKLAVGGMAQVYAARDRILDREVALKVLPPVFALSPQRRRRHEREARIAARLNHPNIVTLYSAEHVDGLYFITMELVKGETLGARIPTGGMSIDDFFPIASGIASAVAAAHARGVTHRDLKPDNIMIDESGLVKVLDFGLAKAKLGFHTDRGSRERFSSEQGLIVGTIPYMSPEQAEGKTVDERSDIFSMGSVFYEMLTGQMPFGGDTSTAMLSSVVRDTPVAPRNLTSRVPEFLERIVLRCLEKRKRRRYQTALELIDDLVAARNACS